jgi:uncharacterized integral membrane protein
VHRGDDPERHSSEPVTTEPVEDRLTPEQRRRRTMVKVVVALALVVLFILFIAWNTDPTTVNFVFFEVRTELIWVFLGCALFGALIAYLMGRGGRRANQRYIKELERRLKERG